MKDKTFDACLKVIQKEGWKAFSFAKASAESGIPLAKFHAQFSCPADVMLHLFTMIDEEVLKSIDISKETSHKDALFEILMARFDAATPYKPIIKSFWQDWILAPEDAPGILCHGYSSMAWMLEAAGLSTRGFSRVLRIQGLTTLYLYTLKTWLEDESPDLGKTMVALDDGLGKLEKAAKVLRFF